MQGRKGSRSLTHTADGSCRVRPRNLSGRTTGKSRQTGRRDRVTAAAKRTLASLPARLRWRHGTARTRHSGHITENPQGHAPHGRVKAEPPATSLFRRVQRTRRMTSRPPVTAPRPVGRGFPLLRPQPSVRRIYAGLHGQRRRVPPPLVPVFLFAGC